MTLYTQSHRASQPTPYFQTSLSGPPLNLQAGETVTVTARYSSHTQTLTHTVLPGSQQLDLVLPKNYASDYRYEDQFWTQVEPGQFTYPRAVATDRLGNVYVLEYENARIQVFDDQGQFLRQWGSQGNLPGQFRRPEGIAVDLSGNVYVADTENHRIQKFTNQGVFLTEWGLQGVEPGQVSRPSAVTVDSGGNIYVATNHRSIQRFNGEGALLTEWSYSTEAEDIAVDSDGNVYMLHRHGIQKFTNQGSFVQSWSLRQHTLSTYAIAVDDSDNVYVAAPSIILKFSSQGVFILRWGSGGSGEGQFEEAQGIVVDANSNVYVADSYNHRIQKFTSDGTFLTQWGSYGLAPATFLNPDGIAVDEDGTIYVTDAFDHRIQKFTSDGMFITQWGSEGAAPGQFNYPGDIAVDLSGNVFVPDRFNHRVQKFTSDGTFLLQWGTHGSSPGQFDYPEGIEVDSRGNVYVLEGSHRVQKFTGDGTLLAQWGSYGSGPGQFAGAKDIAIDADGSIYVVDKGNRRVQKFTSEGLFLLQWGTLGTAPGQFSEPEGVAIDMNGDVYVTDSGNYRIQKFTSEGAFLAQWGTQGAGLGQFGYPQGIVVDREGAIYVADTYNHRVQRLSPMAFTAPLATIAHLSATSLDTQDTLVALSKGYDSDETPGIVAYRWTSDLDGVLGTTATLSIPASTLSLGEHQLTLEVQDDEGQWSVPARTDLDVTAPPEALWTMLLYLAGDYQDQQQLLRAFQRTLTVLRYELRNPNVRIAIQLDGPRAADTRRYLISPGTATLPPTVLEIPYAEQAMDAPATLAAFVRWGQDSFPAEHYYLAIADHGQGLQGIAWDMTSAPDWSAYLTVPEIEDALGAPGLLPIDVLHLDACSMGLLDVAYQLRDRAQVLVVSQYLGWNFFAYNDYQQAMTATSTPQEVGRAVVERYAALSRFGAYPFTLSALDLRRAAPTYTALNRLTAELNAYVLEDPTRRTQLAMIWQATQKLDSNGDYLNDERDLYLDLTDWATRIQSQINNASIQAQVATLLNELSGPYPFVLANQARGGHLPRGYSQVPIRLSGVYGVSMFYPRAGTSQLYANYLAARDASIMGADAPALDFALDAHWPDLLRAAVGEPAATLEPAPGPMGTLAATYELLLPYLTR